MARGAGLEPTTEDLESPVLPLKLSPCEIMAEGEGLDPPWGYAPPHDFKSRAFANSANLPLVEKVIPCEFIQPRESFAHWT